MLVPLELFYDALQRLVEKPDNEPVHRRISAYALVIRDAAVLTAIPTWHALYELPGGGIEEGEDLKAGIERECAEETGYAVEVDVTTVLHAAETNFFHNNGKFYRSSISVHPGRLLSETPDTTRVNAHEEEIAKSGWTPLEELTAANCTPIVWPAIEQAKNA